MSEKTFYKTLTFIILILMLATCLHLFYAWKLKNESSIITVVANEVW